jgi:hypothetical protein
MPFMATSPKKKQGRPRKHPDGNEGRSGQAVHVYLDPVLMDALAEFRASYKEFPPRKTEILEQALREFLQSRGHWPPPK